jgi:hypothetical protein
LPIYLEVPICHKPLPMASPAIDPRTLQVHQRGRRRLAFCIRQGRILIFRTWEFLAGIHLNLDGPFANAKRLVADIDDVPT